MMTLVTRPQALCVTKSNQTSVVYFGLWRDGSNLNSQSDFFNESGTERMMLWCVCLCVYLQRLRNLCPAGI